MRAWTAAKSSGRRRTAAASAWISVSAVVRITNNGGPHLTAPAVGSPTRWDDAVCRRSCGKGWDGRLSGRPGNDASGGRRVREIPRPPHPRRRRRIRRSRSGLLARGPSVVSLPTRISGSGLVLNNRPFPLTAAGPRRHLTGFPRAGTFSMISHGGTSSRGRSILSWWPARSRVNRNPGRTDPRHPRGAGVASQVEWDRRDEPVCVPVEEGVAALMASRGDPPAARAGRPNGWTSAWSADQQEWHDAAVRFATRELADDLLGRDERREFWREGWRRCAAFGIQGLPIPEEYGGQGRTSPSRSRRWRGSATAARTTA